LNIIKKKKYSLVKDLINLFDLNINAYRKNKTENNIIKITNNKKIKDEH